MAGAATRATRSDGERSRRAILRTAARLATTRGLEHLSIGELAAEAGMSKSGLYAHFGSKEELQLATVATAEEIFEAEVLAPARRVPAGRDGLIALADAFLDHLRNRVFPGGCFFDGAAAELHARGGPVRDRVAAFQAGWMALMRHHLALAREQGDLPADEDLDQVLFDVSAYLTMAHSMFTFTGDERALDRAARAVRTRLGAP
jgi:AcrR family transcriptional regulator